jgi:hypothetical protein
MNMWSPRALFVLVASLAAVRTIQAATAPAVLINSGHAAPYVTKDLAILHPELNSPSGLSAIDNTCGGATTASACAANLQLDLTIVADSQNTSLANLNVATSQYPVNHAPYVLVNNSFSAYNQSFWDLQPYAQLQADGVLMSWAYVETYEPGTPPPLVSVTTTATSGPASLAATNWGLEFGMANNYKGFDTSAPSWVTAAMTAVLAAMKLDHPSWSWFDIKAALRQTASNWATGWNPAQFGYGAIDYDSATSIPSTAALYLQPPVLQLSKSADGKIVVTLYPFRSSRRAYEVVYVIPTGYLFPMKNELTAADISNLVSAGGQLVFTGSHSDVIPTGEASFTPTPGMAYTLVAFTTDGLGSYSRVETWCPQSVTDPAADAPLPMWAYAALGFALPALTMRRRRVGIRHQY